MFFDTKIEMMQPVPHANGSAAAKMRRQMLELVQAMTPEERAALDANLPKDVDPLVAMDSQIGRAVLAITRDGNPSSCGVLLLRPLEANLMRAQHELTQLDRHEIAALSDAAQLALHEIGDVAGHIAANGVHPTKEPKEIAPKKTLRARWDNVRHSLHTLREALAHEAELAEKYAPIPITTIRLQRADTERKSRQIEKWQEWLDRRHAQKTHRTALYETLSGYADSIDALKAEGKLQERHRLPEAEEHASRRWTGRIEQPVMHASEIER
jgi:hypothetical protein